MQFRIGNTHFRFDLLTLLFPLLAVFLGESETAILLAISLFAHEASHLAAARLLGVSIPSLRLTPFGGIARMENPYGMGALKLCTVAAAGPAANLLLILITASLCHWRLLASHTAASLLEINVLLMFFNLLPALPLDGGRILYAMLSAFLPQRRALEVGILAGRILAGLLILLSFWGFVRLQRLNLSPLFAAVFLLTAAESERRAQSDSRIQAFLKSAAPLTGSIPVRIFAVEASVTPEIALRTASPDRVTLFAIYENGVFTRIIDDRALLSRLIHSG